MTIIVSVPWAEMERIAIPLQRTRQILAQQIRVVQMEFALQQVSVYFSSNLIRKIVLVNYLYLKQMAIGAFATTEKTV